MLPDPLKLNISEHIALAMTVNQQTNTYTVVVARSKQVPDDYLQWNLSIEVYDSVLKKWISSVSEVLRGWRGGDEGVICNGVFYCLIYSTALVGNTEIGMD